MRKIVPVPGLIGLLCGLFFFGALTQVMAAEVTTTPGTRHGQKWRIGYYEGGAYSEYVDTMRTFIDGLLALGWIQGPVPAALSGDVPRPYWDWLVRCRSDYLEFKPENSYCANWDTERRVRIRQEVMDKLRSRELDLIIAMGTWAGQDLANSEHAVPTLVLSTSDPIDAGIIRSAKDSGLDHVTARVDPLRYQRQLRMFHRIVGFKTLGVAYENTPEGLIYAAMDDIQHVAQERHFKVITCEVIDTTQDKALSDQSCMECMEKLARTADAVYITALACVDRQIAAFADILIDHKKPTFSMIGSKYVEKGLLLSISSDSGYQAQGLYNATKFAQILNGAVPRTLPQEFKDPLHISVNLSTAEKIGFTIPGSILKIAQETYRD